MSRENYTALFNYDTNSARVELLREMGAVMPRGGGAPFFGEHARSRSSADYAWTCLPSWRPAAPNPDAAPDAFWELEHANRLVKAAMANNATTTPSGTSTDVSFTVGGKYKMEGTINAEGQVEKVRTWIDQPIVGDMLIETTYSDYKDFGGGVIRPSHVVTTQDGYPSLDLTISAVTVNPAADITVPDNVKAFTPPAVTVTADKLGDGVFYLKGGTHHSLAIEMADHIVVVDTPQNQTRAEAVLAKAKEVIRASDQVRRDVAHNWDHSVASRRDRRRRGRSHARIEQGVPRTRATDAPTRSSGRQPSRRRRCRSRRLVDDGSLPTASA